MHSGSKTKTDHSSQRFRKDKAIPFRAHLAAHRDLVITDQYKTIGIAIDPSKAFHKVLIFDFQCNIIKGPFEIDVFRRGLERLLKSIEEARAERRARNILLGIEASGALSWHLTRELANRFTHVYLFNPLTVATARKGRLLLGQKSDAIDVAVIGDLLLRGQGYPIQSNPQPVYLTLQELTYWRDYKTHLAGKLKQQLADRFEKVYPGTTSSINGFSPLIANINRNSLSSALIKLELTAQTIERLSSKSLRNRLTPFIGARGKPSPVRLKGFFREMLHPPLPLARLEIRLLQRELHILETVQKEIAEVEHEMVELVRQTPGRWLLGQIRGLSDIQVARYIGALGDPGLFSSAKKVYSLAGLVPRQHQSGGTKRKTVGITKTGRRILRTVLYQMVCTVAMHEPIFYQYRHRLRQHYKKSFRAANIATANKLNRTLIALMRDQSAFRRRGDTQ